MTNVDWIESLVAPWDATYRSWESLKPKLIEAAAVFSLGWLLQVYWSQLATWRRCPPACKGL